LIARLRWLHARLTFDGAPGQASRWLAADDPELERFRAKNPSASARGPLIFRGVK